MKILVTGAAGFIGSNLAERLNQVGMKVTGLDCFLNNYPAELKYKNISGFNDSGIDLIKFNLATDDISLLAKLDIDYIVHCAAQPGIDPNLGFEPYFSNNIIGTKRLADACKSLNIKGFINISTSSVYGLNATKNEETAPKPISYYGVTKLTAEQIILYQQRNGILNACSLRLYSVYGPRERPEKLYYKLIEAILNDKEFPLFDGSEKHKRSYTYIDDILNGIVSVLNNFDVCDGEIINIGNNDSFYTKDGIEIVEKLMGKKAKIKILPKRTGDQLATHANIDKAKSLLKYNPSTTLEEGLSKEIDWFINHIWKK